MKLLFIRHGAATDNLAKRYIGCRTDVPLCPEGIAALREKSYPPCEVLVCSPMRRCVQTAEILFPGQEMHLNPYYRECDFGDFEGKNYQELSGDPDYQKWLDSGGTIAFPNGEHPDAFRIRCQRAFLASVVFYDWAESIAFVVHGGTIMAILSHFAGGDFYDYQLPNGGAYAAEFDKGHITRWERL